MRKQSIRDVFNGKKKSHNNLIFCKIDDSEYDTLINKSIVNDILDDNNQIIVMSGTHLYDDDLT